MTAKPKNRNCYLFVFDGYADWEPALAIALLEAYTPFLCTYDKNIITANGAAMIDFALEILKNAWGVDVH